MAQKAQTYVLHVGVPGSVPSTDVMFSSASLGIPFSSAWYSAKLKKIKKALKKLGTKLVS